MSLPQNLSRILHPLLLSVALLPLAAAEKPTLSPQLRERLLASLPPYQPPAAETAPAPADAAPAAETPTDAILLPKFTVKSDRFRRVEPDAWLTEQARSDKALAIYRDKRNALDWLLNSWHIPLLTPSAKARARAEYEEARLADERDRLNRIADVVSRLDPADAAKLHRALDPARAPGGD